MAISVVSSTNPEPVSVPEAKTHLRVDYSADDSYIGSLLRAAREHVETTTRRSLTRKTWRRTLDDWPRGDTIELPRTPLGASTAVTVTYRPSTGGGDLTLSSTSFLVDDESIVGRVVLKSGENWPSETLREANAVTVEWEAGYEDAGAVPDALKHGIKLLVSHWYVNREGVSGGSVFRKVPQTVDALLSGYRVIDVPGREG